MSTLHLRRASLRAPFLAACGGLALLLGACEEVPVTDPNEPPSAERVCYPYMETPHERCPARSCFDRTLTVSAKADEPFACRPDCVKGQDVAPGPGIAPMIMEARAPGVSARVTFNYLMTRAPYTLQSLRDNVQSVLMTVTANPEQWYEVIGDVEILSYQNRVVRMRLTGSPLLYGVWAKGAAVGPEICQTPTTPTICLGGRVSCRYDPSVEPEAIRVSVELEGVLNELP
jgi:hypothetical protein